MPRFITKKWTEVYDQSGGTYNTNKQIRFKTSVLRSDLRDYNDAYIVVKGDITVDRRHNRDRKNRSLALKNNAPFISCISKLNGVLIENAEDLDIIMPMYNLLEYSKNLSDTSGSLWNYYRDEPNNPPAVEPPTNPPNFDYNADPITNSVSLKYKNGFIRKTPKNDNYNNNARGVEIVVPLKHLGNFWNSLYIPLVNCD